MTEIQAIERLESCLDGSEIWEYQTTDALREEDMRRLAQGSTLKYYPTFPRPYFRIEHPRLFVLQGVLGNITFRATFSRGCREEGHGLILDLLITGKPS